MGMPPYLSPVVIPADIMFRSEMLLGPTPYITLLDWFVSAAFITPNTQYIWQNSMGLDAHGVFWSTRQIRISQRPYSPCIFMNDSYRPLVCRHLLNLFGRIKTIMKIFGSIIASLGVLSSRLLLLELHILTLLLSAHNFWECIAQGTFKHTQYHLSRLNDARQF